MLTKNNVLAHLPLFKPKLYLKKSKIFFDILYIVPPSLVYMTKGGSTWSKICKNYFYGNQNILLRNNGKCAKTLFFVNILQV